MPVCFAFADDHIVSPVDEKPQEVPPDALRRSRNIAQNPRVTLVVDHYTKDWSRLGWVQVRGTAAHCGPEEDQHPDGLSALRAKYDQYATHILEERPLIRIEPGSVRSWGQLERAGGSAPSL